MTTPTEEYDAVAAEAAGVSQTEIVFVDYFGFEERRRWYFPDRVQYIEYKLLNEGDKVKYQSNTRSKVTIGRGSGDAAFEMDQGKERTELIMSSVVGWQMFKRSPETGKPVSVPYRDHDFRRWLLTADPVLVQKLETEIRKANPWLLGDADQSVEEIDKEIVRLQELREAALDRAQGEASSSDK